MKIKRILLSAFVVAVVWGCANQVKDKGWDVTVKGKVGFPGTGTIEISELGVESKADTIQLNSNYTFEKTLHVQEPGYYRLNFYGKQYVDLILDSATVEVNVDGNSQEGFVEVKGSPDSDLMQEVELYLHRAQTGPAVVALEAEFQAARQSSNQKMMEELQQQYAGIIEKANDSLVIILGKKPVSLGLVNLLQRNVIDKDQYTTFYKETADRLKRTWPASRHTLEFVAFVEKMMATAIGQKAPEISLPDQNGRVVTLSSLQGKYVLVDFWAKWCGPCRRENPTVVAAYNKYKSKGFEVLGVSLDRSREDWVRAIQEDGLTWTHVSDLKYFESQAAKDYNIGAIPFSILVDPNGIIVAKNLRGPALDKKLGEIFQKGS